MVTTRFVDDLAPGGQLHDGVAEVPGHDRRPSWRSRPRRPRPDRRPCRAGRRRAGTRLRRRAAAPATRAIMPVSTSPVPPVAMPAFPVGLMNTLPSGVAISVRCPFSTTYTWWPVAKFRAISSRFAWTSSRRHADQPRHLAGMRRDDDVPSLPPAQRVRIAGERVQAVRIDHERHGRPLDERSRTNALTALAAPRPGPATITSCAVPARDSTRRPKPPIGPVRRPLRGPRSCTPAPSRRASAGSCAAVATVTRPAPDRSAPMRREVARRRSCRASPAIDEHAAIVALVRCRAPAA